MGLAELRHVSRLGARTKMTSQPGLSCVLFAMILLISLQLCSCFVLREHINKPVYKIKKEYKKHFKDEAFGYDISEPLDVVEMKPVSIYQFETELHRARDYRDVLRIFYGKHLSDNIVDEILEAEVPYEKHRHHREHGVVSDGRHDRRRDVDAAIKHMDEMSRNEFTKCKPRPKVIHMQDNLSLGTKILFWPACTVIYKCQQDSGCCGHDTKKLCLPKTVERVSKSFLVIERFIGELVQPRHEGFTDNFVFENHTECECQYKATHNKNKCSECPFPYTLTKGPPYCTCDCDPDSIVCMEIKAGNRSFDEKPLQCIKEELCQTPICAFGNFDRASVRSGYCPSKKKPAPFPHVQFNPERDRPPQVTEIDADMESGSGYDDDMEDDEYEEEFNSIDHADSRP